MAVTRFSKVLLKRFVSSKWPTPFVNSRAFSSDSGNGNFQTELLLDRAAIQVQGSEAADFLQGLITNDINHLLRESEAEASLKRSVFAMFLNTGGRVMFESIIYHIDNDKFILDCDLASGEKLLRHLKMYKLRKKIDLSLLKDYETWTIFHMGPLQENATISTLSQDFKGLNIFQNSETFCTADPRVKALGFRVLAPKQYDQLCYQLRELDGDDTFANLRFRLGVAEGANEMEPGKALPLEYNADYSHGVSFHKGCYIGQELTARTHHTGVIRKRVMPIHFEERLSEPLETATFVNANNKNVGKLIAADRTDGIGLMRIENCADQIHVKDNPDIKITVSTPHWWPKVSPKRLTVNVDNSDQ